MRNHFIEILLDYWNFDDEGKIMVILFFLVFILTFIGVWGFVAPAFISSSSTLLVIVGLLSPFLQIGFMYNIFSIFFKSER